MLTCEKRVDWNKDASSEEDGVLEKGERRVNGWEKMVIEIVIWTARGVSFRKEYTDTLRRRTGGLVGIWF